MIEKKLFEKHYSRMVLEGILKSALWGIFIGAIANFAAALMFWLFGVGGILLALGIGAGVAPAVAAALYFIKFRPTSKDIARRVDRLGLQERLITMVELQGDDSRMAQLQREDAVASLRSVADQKLRLRVSGLLIAGVAASLLISGGMNAVVKLAEQGVIPSGPSLLDPEDPMENHIAVTYFVEEGGEIQGETDQLLLPGESTTPVVAVAEDGWMFVGWDDGGKNPERFETGVTEELYFVAIFEEILDGDGEAGESDKNNNNAGGKEEGDKAEDLPEGGDANVESDSNGGDGDKGSGSGDSGESDGAKGESDEQGEGKGDGQGLGAGGKWQDSNQFIDGETYYRDHLDMYYEMAQEIFAANGEIPPEWKEFFEMYYDSL